MTSADDPKLQELQSTRRLLYAAITSMLLDNVDVPGAEAMFDTALTNGLLAIVQETAPERLAGDRLPAAESLLNQLKSILPSKSKQIEVAPATEPLPLLGDHDGFPATTVDTKLLKDAIARTGARRHGRAGGGPVTAEDVEELRKLDMHAALGALHGFHLEQLWEDTKAADSVETQRATDYLALLDADEVNRRQEAAADQIAYEQHDDPYEPQLCPVCEHTAMRPTGGDDFGYGITAASCLVCSYNQSANRAYDLGMDAEWELRWV